MNPQKAETQVKTPQREEKNSTEQIIVPHRTERGSVETICHT